MLTSHTTQKDSGGLMQPLDPKVYEALLEIYEDRDEYHLIVDCIRPRSTFRLQEDIS